MAPKGGMSAWIESLAGHLPEGSVRLNTAASKIEPISRNRWQITTTSGESIQADGILLATPASVSARLLSTVSSQASSLVGSIPYASSAVVAMIVNRAEIQGRLDGFGIVVPSCENRQALAISFTSNKYPGRTPDDQVLLRIFLGGSLHPETLELPDQQLEAIAFDEAKQILRWTGQGLRWKAVIRWNQAMPQYLVGHVQKVKQLDLLLDDLKTLRVCGAAYNGVGIPQCVRSGQEAARKLVTALSSVGSLAHGTS